VLEFATPDMRGLAAGSKDGVLAALVRTGLSPADARALVAELTTTPQAHRAARQRIGEALEVRPA
jgi:hypothetical protein